MARKSAPKTQNASANKVATAIKDKMPKSEILSHLASQTGLTRGQVGTVLEELEVLIQRHVKKRGAGEFTLPGLLKIRSVRRPPTKKRMGRNPATGEQIMIPSKPASTSVRVTALKRLKDMVL